MTKTNEFILADRGNLNVKCGIHAGTLIGFTAEESTFVARGETTAAWADVVALAQDMIVYAQEQQQKQQQQQQQDETQSEPVTIKSEDSDDGEQGTDGETEVQASDSDDSEPQGEDQDSNSGTAEGETREDGEGSAAAEGDEPSEQEPEGQSESTGVTGKKKPSNEKSDGINPTTNSNLEKALEAFAQSGSQEITEIIRVTTRELSQSVKVVDFKTVLSDMRGCGMSRFMAQPIRISDYTTASTAMATAFNRRKAADNWRRTSVSKSGSFVF